MTNNSILMKCLVIALLLCILSPSFAQVRYEPPVIKKKTIVEEKARDLTRWMYKNLSLDRDQHEKIYNINVDYAHKVDSLDKLKDQIIKTEFKTRARKQRDSLFKNTLTTQQYKQYIWYRKRQAAKPKPQ